MVEATTELEKLNYDLRQLDAAIKRQDARVDEARAALSKAVGQNAQIKGVARRFQGRDRQIPEHDRAARGDHGHRPGEGAMDFSRWDLVLAVVALLLKLASIVAAAAFVVWLLRTML